jgi:L-ascorbate metabolism protein UlaG (beta-lactamase superfamily)
MKLRYIGHACFELIANDGTRVITDPYDASVGLAMLPLSADMITMSHEHHDHNCEDMITGKPQRVHGPELACAGSVTSRAVRSWHDDAQGEKRGANFIRIFHIDGLKVVHMGDQGCMPDEDVMEAIADADIMMIPVGGFYTVNAQEAKVIVDAAKPKCVIPMHFITAHGHYSVIADHRAFLDIMGAQDARPVEAIQFDEDCPPKGMLFMKPEADDLA